MSDVIMSTLGKYVGRQDNKSSHWIFHTKDATLSAQTVVGISGFSRNVKFNPFIQFLHTRGQKKVFPNFRSIQNSKYYSEAKRVCKLQKRCLDESVLRHVFTFQLLDPKIHSNWTGAVIGDGQANFVSLALALRTFRKVVSVNLPEILMNDYPLIRKLCSESQIVLVRNKEELYEALRDNDIKVVLIMAHDSDVLLDQGIDFFVNIASFQEMNYQEIDRYFAIVQSNKAYLYVCNRLQKRLYGGEVISFLNYPWGSATVLLDEECPWHQRYYSLRNLNLFKEKYYEGVVQHRLIKF